jgi:hypothetical protein
MIGRLKDMVKDRDGNWVISFTTKDRFDGDKFDELAKVDCDIDIRKHRNIRSKNANSYFHVLVNKIATALGSSDEEVKKQLVVKYGTVETDEDGSAYGAMLPASADIDRFYPYTRCYKTVEQNGKTYNCFLFYKRTRDMDSAEMSHLIDGTVSEAKALDIETLPPDELRSMEDLWNNHQGG